MTVRYAALCCCLALTAMAGRAGAAPATLATLAGSWTVVHVRTDEGTSRRTALPPDDPSLVGRTLAIAPGAVTLQTLQGAQLCGGATLSSKPATLSQLLPGGDADGGGSKPSAYGLPLADDAKVDALILSCAQGGIGSSMGMGASGTGGTWLLPLADGTLAMSYVNGSLLILTHGGAVAPRASFNCAAAASAAEHAVCSSTDLAGLDRSVASAYGADARQFQGIGDPAALGKLRSFAKSVVAAARRLRRGRAPACDASWVSAWRRLATRRLLRASRGVTCRAGSGNIPVE